MGWETGQKRRRSRAIRLTLIGGASALSLASCGECPTLPQGVEYYGSIETCAQSLEIGTCEYAESQARWMHEEASPWYISVNACANQHGAGGCVESNIRPKVLASHVPGPWFRPTMAGFAYGMANGREFLAPAYAGSDGAIYSRDLRLGVLKDGVLEKPSCFSSHIRRYGFGNFGSYFSGGS